MISNGFARRAKYSNFRPKIDRGSARACPRLHRTSGHARAISTTAGQAISNVRWTVDTAIPSLCLRIRQGHQRLEIFLVSFEVSVAPPKRAPTIAVQRIIRFRVANLHCRIVKIRRGGDRDGYSDGVVRFIALVHAQLATVDLSCAANANWVRQ